MLAGVNDLSPDDTFATTLTGIRELRAEHGDGMRGDWIEWKRTVLKSVKAGERLEKLVNGLLTDMRDAAKQKALQSLSARVAALEAERKKNHGRRQQILAALGKVALVVAGAIISRYLK
jgi:hypothetical protein